MTPSEPYDRDLIGYGRTPPHPHWPGDARIAVQFVLNYEEGAENSVLHGDAGSETFLSEMYNPASFAMRHQSIETLYEYGSRAGFWRILRLFERYRLPLTVFGVSVALARHPDALAACRELGHEIACHGLRWINYQEIDEATERTHMAEAVQILRELTGEAPLGWYTGRDSPNTRRLVVEHGGFLYDSDSYADDLPYWTTVDTAQGLRRHLVIPYTMDTNDMRMASPQGFSTGAQFFEHLKDAFDVLYEEGDPDGLNQPRMLNIGLHNRVVGRPGRLASLQRFLEYITGKDKVWVTRRVDIARHWIDRFPAGAGT